uniref:Cation/H+ exchanger transmembrane domain-containing protein n=1 Tax=Alexandrium monilatum TaxID=311494 RepID=A0A7S4UKM0_9DINO
MVRWFPEEPGGDAKDPPRPALRPRLYLAAAAVVCLLALEGASWLARGQRRLTATGGPGPGASKAIGEPPSRRAAAESGAGCGEGAGGDHTSGAFEPIVFFLLTYLLSAIAQQIELVSPPGFRVLPHSVGLFLLGMAMGRIGMWVPETEVGRTIIVFTDVDPHIIFWVLLPALLYEDASSVKWHVMRKVLPSALLLAVPGVILNALLTGAIIKSTFGTLDWTWDAVFLLGSILSATDPVAVVGALHELSAPDKLSLLISGESLFNDGSAVVIFSLFWDSARGVRSLTPGYSIGYFIRLACGGPLLGFAFALVAFEWLKHMRKFSIEILIVLVSVYGSFFVAEHPAVKVSGVLAVVIFGFFMAARGHFALNIEGHHRHHTVIHFLALLSNEAIFVLAGVVAVEVLTVGVHDFQVRDWFELVLLYFIIHGTRTLIVALCLPLLKRWGYGLSLKEAVICVFGGLRGAVGLAMALLVEHDESMDRPTRVRIAFHTSGIVLATLLVNGTLITTVYRRLQLYQEAQHHEKLLRMALSKADSATERRGVMFEQHWFFHNCFFTDLFKALPNLVQAAEEMERKRFRSRLGSSNASELPKGPLHINEVMTNIAHRLGELGGEEGLHKRYMEKLRFRRRWARSASNVFIPVSLQNTEEDEQVHHVVIELAMRMANMRHMEGPVDNLPGASESARILESVSTTSDWQRLPSPPSSPSSPCPRLTTLKVPANGGKPIVAWSDGMDGLEPKAATLDTPPSARPRSVQFANWSAPPEEANFQPTSSVSRPLGNSVRLADAAMNPAMTALPSEMGERDQRQYYKQLREQGLLRQQEHRNELRLKSKQSIQSSVVADMTDSGELVESMRSVRSSFKSRTNLQAQRVDGLFADRKILQIGSAITMTVVNQELQTAIRNGDRKAQAVIRWRMAKVRVLFALRTIQGALQEHQKLVEGRGRGAGLLSGRSASFHAEKILSDSDSMVEVFHTIVNTFRSSYKEMYEARALPEGPYRVLMESLELQEEAIDGELKSAPLAPNNPKLHAKLQRLPDMAHEDQMDFSFLVAWQYIVEAKNRSWDKGRLDFIYKRTRLSQWYQMQHDVVMLLGFIMTMECIGEELEVVRTFEDRVKRPMLQVTQTARASALHQMMMDNPGMFYLFEHLLCLRLMLDFQRRSIRDLVDVGLMSEEDAQRFIDRVIQPVVAELNRYMPTPAQLSIALGRQPAYGSEWGMMSLTSANFFAVRSSGTSTARRSAGQRSETLPADRLGPTCDQDWEPTRSQPRVVW